MDGRTQKLREVTSIKIKKYQLNGKANSEAPALSVEGSKNT